MTGRCHIEISQLIYRANQWTGFYMITASVMKELNAISVIQVPTSSTVKDMIAILTHCTKNEVFH